jgi:DEAD/DEAH box helicase domain-containing protein
MSVESALQALRLQPRFMRNVAHWVREPACPARTAPFPLELNPRLAAALAARGIQQLYTHQAEAVEAGLRGEHVVVVTPAASGKTLCYNLPVLHHLLADPAARALYLYPTKALAQDQLAELHAWQEHLGVEGSVGRRDTTKGRQGAVGAASTSSLIRSPALLTAATYDGDTPSSRRANIRDGARLVLSNPDMLHAGILPQHPRWAAFFAGLRAVVIDEMHVYRGVFGSHVANVLRRLRRICRFYGSKPQFFLASATIANPDLLAERLTEAPVTLIGPDRNGAPRSAREILFYNPPLLDPALGIRRSSTLEASDLAAHFLAHDVQTIVFARTRLATELMLTELRSAQGAAHERANHAIRGYRGGYLPAERREIERGLRDGDVTAVVATNALELGIDIGQLDAAVLAGYPGAIASTRQQMGRAGRRQGLAVGVLVAAADAIDQYLIAHPEYLLERSPEHARLNPDNEAILAGHLACAAAELPLDSGERLGLTRDTSPEDSLPSLLADLVEAGRLYRSGGRYFWAGEGSPATNIGLRSSSPERIVIQRQGADGRPLVIGEMERSSVPRFLYENAIYLHEGASHLVERLDWEAGVASVRPIEVDFYTRPTIGETIEVLTTRARATQTAGCWQASAAAEPHPPSACAEPHSLIAWGDVRVVSRATGYRILRKGSNETLGFGRIDLPEQAIETQGCWLAFTETLVERLRAAGAWVSDPNEYGPNWSRQRDAARARDGYRCQGCGAAETTGKQHDVHHRVPFRSFVADAARRGGLPPERAWETANVLENLVTLCPACHRRAEASVRIRSGLGGAAALLAGVAPLFLMCDPDDLGVVAEQQAPVSGLPTITLFEHTPGGVGFAEQLYHSMPDLLRAALDLVRSCPCAQGCPSCIGPAPEHEYALDAKALARAILEALAVSDRERSLPRMG